MKISFKITGVAALFLALLFPQVNYGQLELNIGDTYEDGIVFQVRKSNWGGSALICQTKDLGQMDWNQAVGVSKKLGKGWRLPTKNELNLMYKKLHKKSRGGFVNDYYWSSDDKEIWYNKEVDPDYVWDQSFGTGHQNFGAKMGYQEYVRVVKKVYEYDPRKFEGGIIFPLDDSGQNFLKCQTNDLRKMEWNEAVEACKKLGDAWRLPTKDELNSMYKYLHIKSRGGFADDYYWSSTDNGHVSYVWDQNFNTGIPTFIDKGGYKKYVRAVKEVRPLTDYPAEIGDLRAGGVVFWVDPTNAKSGLVCALRDCAMEESWGWGCREDLPNAPNVEQTYPRSDPNGKGAEIGEGESNTDGILKDCPDAPAAFASRKLGPEWFLPCAKELNEMYVNKSTLEAVPGFAAFTNLGYWSSTECDIYKAWAKSFRNGRWISESKTQGYKVRPIRAFTN